MLVMRVFVNYCYWGGVSWSCIQQMDVYGVPCVCRYLGQLVDGLYARVFGGDSHDHMRVGKIDC